MTNFSAPTPYPEVNRIVGELLANVQSILGSHFVGMYLYGSLATGDFDRNSDIDFLVVTDVDVADKFLAALQDMHARLAAGDSWWATDLEGAYMPRAAIWRHDPANRQHPHLQRGKDIRLEMDSLGIDWVIQRFILREHGIVVSGPALDPLIAPLSPGDLRQATLEILHERIGFVIVDSTFMTRRGDQSFIVLSVCRVLYTLEYSNIASKRQAAEWAKKSLEPRWAPLIERAWVGRQYPDESSDPNDIAETLEFIRFALQKN